jgi:hypothetical protein
MERSIYGGEGRGEERPLALRRSTIKSLNSVNSQL